MKKSSTSYEKDSWIRYERCDSNTTGIFRYLVDDGDCIIGMDEDGVPKSYSKAAYVFSPYTQNITVIDTGTVENQDTIPEIILSTCIPGGTHVSKHNFLIRSKDDFNGWFKEDPTDKYKCLERIRIDGNKIRIFLEKHHSDDKPRDEMGRIGRGHGIKRIQKNKSPFEIEIRFAPPFSDGLEADTFQALGEYLLETGERHCTCGMGMLIDKFRNEMCGYIEFEDIDAVKYIKKKLKKLRQKKESSCA